jgi:hypothetical protein
MKNIPQLFILPLLLLAVGFLSSCSSFQKWRMEGYKEELNRQEEKTPEGRKRKKDKMLYPERGGKPSTLNDSPYNPSEQAVLQQMREEDKKEAYERSRRIFGIFTPKD